MLKQSLSLLLFVVLCVLAGSGLAYYFWPTQPSVEKLPETHLKVVGAWGNLTQYKNFEQPFWTRQITERSKGSVTADITPFNEMGLKGAEITKMMSAGLIDFGSTVLGYVAADDPRNEALELAGIAPDILIARKVAAAYRPVYDKFYREKFGIEVLAIWPYSGQVVYCNGEIKGLADLKDKRVRTSSRTLAEFVEGLGGTGVTLPFNEVVPALRARSIDCAITGTLSGNSAKWHEVTTHIHTLPLGWSFVMHGVNLKTWSKLDPKVRDFLKTEIGRLEDDIWKAAANETHEGFDCNAGKDSCRTGTKAALTLVPVSHGDKALRRQVLMESVLPKWAARCPDCVTDWNGTIGKIVGIYAEAR